MKVKKTMERICGVREDADSRGALMAKPGMGGEKGRRPSSLTPGGKESWLMVVLLTMVQMMVCGWRWKAAARCSIQARTAGNMPRRWV
ncbi:hypothetical protein D9M68_994290 [compost metagenome]